MEQSLSEKFRKLLKATTQEEFNKDWAEVLSMGFQGPLAKDFINKVLLPESIDSITNLKYVSILDSRTDFVNEYENFIPSLHDSITNQFSDPGTKNSIYATAA